MHNYYNPFAYTFVPGKENDYIYIPIQGKEKSDFKISIRGEQLTLKIGEITKAFIMEDYASIKADEVKASYEDEVLRIRLPKINKIIDVSIT